MLFNFFKDYPFIVYSLITWSFILIFIKVKIVKILWPIALLGGGILFIATYWLTSINLYMFNNPFLPILGIPFFYILWGTANGLIFAYYYSEKSILRFISVFGFSALVVLTEALVEIVDKGQHLGKFNNLYEYIFNVFILCTLYFLMTNLFKNRLARK